MPPVEQAKKYHITKAFKGINTKANRTAIDGDEFSWLENIQPIGFGNLKVINAPSAINNSGGNAVVWSNTVSYFSSVSISGSDYVLAFQSNGAAQAYNITTQTLSNIASAGFFTGAGVRATQWKDERALITDPEKGYYTWNGSNIVYIGSISGGGIVSGGSGYTTTPAIVISAPNDANGVQATAEATVTANVITAVTIIEPGSGYNASPTVTVTGGGGSGANIVLSYLNFNKGTASALITNGGTGYSNVSNLTVTFAGGGGSNAAGVGIISGGQVTQIVMTNYGSGYTNAANLAVTIAGGGGANATAVGIVQNNDISDVASFSGRTWISQGRTIFYSAPDTYNDFISVAAGSFVLTDSTLRGNIDSLLSANNFLYIFGEDSINVFSDVRVDTNGITLFSNTNVSAAIGSRRKGGIFPYFRSVLILNDYGIYALVGATTAKISDALDGVFEDIDFSYPITGGLVIINNIICAAFNAYYDDGSGVRPVQFVFFDKKWFVTSQGTLTRVVSSPIGGTINLYGTTGTNLVQLYANASANISTTVSTALWPLTDMIRDKQALKFGIEATITQGGVLNVTVDQENRSSAAYTLTNEVAWVNNVNQEISWLNLSNAVVTWTFAEGYSLYKSDAEQYGKYLGLTVTSNSPSFTINTFELEYELRARF